MSRTELSKTQLFPVLLRAASLSNLDNTVINNSISNTKYAEFCTKQQVLLHFHSPNYAYNHLYNLDQKTVPLLQSIFTFLFQGQFLPPYSTWSQNHIYNSHEHSLCLYLSNFAPPYFCVQPSQQSSPKLFFLSQPFSQFRLCQETTELGSFVVNEE